jgi:hypothetical protein
MGKNHPGVEESIPNEDLDEPIPDEEESDEEESKYDKPDHTTSFQEDGVWIWGGSNRTANRTRSEQRNQQATHSIVIIITPIVVAIVNTSKQHKGEEYKRLSESSPPCQQSRRWSELCDDNDSDESDGDSDESGNDSDEEDNSSARLTQNIKVRLDKEIALIKRAAIDNANTPAIRKPASYHQRSAYKTEEIAGADEIAGEGW